MIWRYRKNISQRTVTLKTKIFSLIQKDKDVEVPEPTDTLTLKVFTRASSTTKTTTNWLPGSKIYTSNCTCATHERCLPKRAWNCFSPVCAGPADHVVQSEPRRRAAFLTSSSTERRCQQLLCDRTKRLDQEDAEPGT